MWPPSVCSEAALPCAARPVLARLVYRGALAAIGGAALGMACAQSVELKNPVGGWHASSMDAEGDKAAVAYPYNLIDRGAQKYRTLIQGRLRTLRADGSARPQADASLSGTSAKDTKSEHTLVVNGNPMPLYTGADGEFIRPYAFGSGSNSVEIRGGQGQPARRVQFYETPAGRPQAALRVIAAWDDN
ncbi:MAG: hypothetical protein V4772_12375, partial [Pseudomonadota bacterium]